MSNPGTIEKLMNPGLLEKQEAYAVPKLGTGGKSQQLALHGEGTSRPQPPKSAVATYIPGAELPSGVARIVETVKLLFQVRLMQEHVDAMTPLDKDILWDAPPILLTGKESMRVCMYLAKSIAFLSLEPELIHVYPLGFDRTIVEIQATCLLAPKHTVLVPITLLLPDSVPIRATLKVGVKGPLDSGKIELIDGKWHNLPSFPNIIRSFNAFVMGTLMYFTEPFWSWTLELVGDDYYRKQWQARLAKSKLS
eukprot:gene10716-10872_t